MATCHWMKNQKPNGDETQCQCVRCHGCFTNGGLAQCPEDRDKKSNLFCAHCEEMHGEMHRAELDKKKEVSK